jgi:hypothetical protein
MQWTGEIERGEWIRGRLSRAGGTAGSVVPQGFAAYARILHPVPACRPEAGPGTDGSPAPSASSSDGEADPEEAWWSWAQVAAETGGLIHPRVQWIRLAGSVEEPVRVRGGWELNPPEEGRLEPRLLARLMRLAGSSTTTPEELTVGMWDGWAWGRPGSTAALVREGATARERRAADAEVRAQGVAAVDPHVARALAAGPLLELPDRRYVLLRATAEELSDPTWPERAGIGWHHGLEGPMPQLVWPADRAWCVASEIDWDSTLVGGSHELIRAVLEDGALEAVRVDPSDDLTWDGDRLNRPS